MKLLIAIPAYETLRCEFVQSLMGLTERLHREGIAHEVKILGGTLVHVARDALARHAVNNGYTDVLWIDSDMVFEPSILEDLMMCGKDMVCGLFISRHSPYLNCVFSSLNPVKRVDRFPEEAFRVAACGFGCVLMKAQILADVMRHQGGKCFIPTPRLGEDCAFCERVRAEGYEIWCEPTARIGHVGPVVIWPEDAEKLRGDIQGLDGKELN